LDETSCVFINRNGPRCIEEGTMLNVPDRWPGPVFERTKLMQAMVRIALAGPVSEQIQIQEVCDVEVILVHARVWEM